MKTQGFPCLVFGEPFKINQGTVTATIEGFSDVDSGCSKTITTFDVTSAIGLFILMVLNPSSGSVEEYLIIHHWHLSEDDLRSHHQGYPVFPLLGVFLILIH